MAMSCFCMGGPNCCMRNYRLPPLWWFEERERRKALIDPFFVSEQLAKFEERLLQPAAMRPEDV